MLDVKPPIAFSELIRNCRIEVPLIQRDYAQGRDGQKDLRDDFLGALFEALASPPSDAKRPLNLDFIYGSMEAENDRSFLPLDGQQRLTTLFLLHWYLAWRDSQLLDFKEMVWDGRRSRFNYCVRPSSTEFFDGLVQFVPESSPDDVTSVCRLIEDQSWFFLHWRSDPTIQAVLTMLDAIHERFRTAAGLYARLVDEGRPAITFHLLPLEHFGLSDDLYIKMNARGKPLTSFETFKARFEELLKHLFPTETRPIGDDELPVPVFFERRMDTQWTDFFWSHQRATFDAAAMNLIWALIRVSLEPASTKFAADTSALGDKNLAAGFTLFHDRGWLSRRFADHLMDLLESWSEGGRALRRQLPSASLFDEAEFFRRAISSPSTLRYLELVQFAAFVLYLTHHRGGIQSDAFQDWMRVITNLASNSDIERPEEFGRGLAGLHKLVPNANRIVEYFAEGEIESVGFSPQQVREEVLKAKLILSRPGWRERICAAEAHGYFRGQVEFLLKFSGVLDRWLNENSVAWGDAEDAEYQRQFSSYFEKAAAVFSADGLKDFGACRWERALLMKGDYLLERGINRCLLDNAERDANWKRLLRGSFRPAPVLEQKRQLVRELLDEIDLHKGVEGSLNNVLTKPLPAEPWRRAMIEKPEIIEYCEGRKVRRHGDGNIYLLRRTQMNGEHAELFTFHLKIGLLTAKHQKGELTPFGEPRYQSVSRESDVPYAYFEWKRAHDTVAVSISNVQESYRIDAIGRGGQLPSDIQDALEKKAPFNRAENGATFQVVEKAGIEAAIDEIVGVVRWFAA